MTFMHKLSRRLAQAHEGPRLLCVLALVAGCERPLSPGDPSSHVTQILVVPESLTVDPAGQAGFGAYGRTTSGDSIGTAVSWTASGGAITGTGMFTADTAAGDFRVTATSSSLGLSGSSTVHVRRPKSVASVSVTPAAVSLTIGRTAQLVATPRDSAGNPLSGRMITWASSNPAAATVTGSGLVSGVAVGSTTVTATSGGQSGTAAVAVTSVPVASVAVSPASASVSVGQTVQLTATPKDASGNPLSGRLITWASSSPAAATVNGSGLVSGVAVGSTTITSTSEGKSGTAGISVTATGPPPGECATPQASWIWCDDFEQDRSSAYFEYDNGGGSFTRVSGVGLGGSYGMRAQFAVGQVSAGSLHLAFGKTPQAYFRPVDAGTAIYRNIYWRVYVKHQAGWVGGGGNKFSRAFSFASSTSWAQAMFAHVWSGDTPDTNYLILDPASGTDSVGNLVTTTYNDFPNMRWLGLKRGVTPLFDASHVGQWYCVEAHAQLNDAGLSNGVFEFWINGNLEARATGLNWLGNFSAYGINAVYLENFWNAGSPAAQERYFDNFVVSTQRIGC